MDRGLRTAEVDGPNTRQSPRVTRRGPRPRRSRTLTTGMATGMCLLVLVLAGCASEDNGQFRFVAPGGQAQIFYDPPVRGRVPAVSGDMLTAPGRTVASSDFAGQVVVVNVWGSWCGPCRAETPQLEQVQERTRALGVQFLGVDVRDDRSAATDFVRDRAVSYPSIYDPPGRSLIALRGFPRNVVPSTIVLDREHRVAAIFLTAVLASDIEPVVRRLAAEPAPVATSVAPPPAPASGHGSDTPARVPTPG